MLGGADIDDRLVEASRHSILTGPIIGSCSSPSARIPQSTVLQFLPGNIGDSKQIKSKCANKAGYTQVAGNFTDTRLCAVKAANIAAAATIVPNISMQAAEAEAVRVLVVADLSIQSPLCQVAHRQNAFPAASSVDHTFSQIFARKDVS